MTTSSPCIAPLTWSARFVRLGHLRAVLLVTGISVLMSLVLTRLGMLVIDPTGEGVPMAMGLATLVPSIVAPIVTLTVLRLMTALENTRAEMQQLAIRDSLTQVYNRRYFMAQLQREAERFFRTGERLCLLMIDADEFKSVNDRFGHATGDRVLQMIAEVCTSALREYDVLARFGGEEFAVLLPATGLSDAYDVAERIRATVGAATVDAGEAGRIGVTVSIGVSSLASADPECRELFDTADSALYDAKRGGRNRTVVMPLPDVSARTA
jgi:diguanylate cyclase (GGDEF)-like protein